MACELTEVAQDDDSHDNEVSFAPPAAKRARRRRVVPAYEAAHAKALAARGSRFDRPAWEIASAENWRASLAFMRGTLRLNLTFGRILPLEEDDGGGDEAIKHWTIEVAEMTSRVMGAGGSQMADEELPIRWRKV